MWQSSVFSLQWSISLWVATSAFYMDPLEPMRDLAVEANKTLRSDIDTLVSRRWRIAEELGVDPFEEAAQQRMDLTQSAVDRALTSAQPQVQTGYEEAIPVRGNDEGEVRENIRHFLNSLSNGNPEVGIYRNNLRAEVVHERHAFDGMNDELRFNQDTANQRRHPSKHLIFSAETSVAKREVELVKKEERPAKLAVIKKNWEAAYEEMKRARNETDILQITKAFRATAPNDALFMEPNNMYSDLALYLCALTVSRMCIEDLYAKEVCPNPSAAQSSKNQEALVKDWRTYFDKTKTPDSFAGRVREAFSYRQPFNDEYAQNFTQSLVRLTELFRKYEAKIPELQAQFDARIAKDGTRIGLWHTLINDTDWNMNFDDVYVINRIRHAEVKPKITFLWLNIDEKTVMPFCVEHGY